MRDKLKSVNFWLSVIGGLILLIQSFGVKIDAPAANEALTLISGALILAGVLRPDKSAGGDGADSGKAENDKTDGG
jgi:uncharacterized membrane protein